MLRNDTRPTPPNPNHRSYAGAAGKAASICEAAQKEAACSLDPPLPEIPRALRRAFDLSEELSEAIARLDSKIRPVSRCSPPACEQKGVEAETEIGSAVEQLAGRMELMLGAVGSMIHRVEL